MPDETPPRRFTLIDLMALVAASAASLWIFRAQGLAGDRDGIPVAMAAKRTAFALLAPLTAASLGLRLLKPRPARGEVFDRPGAAAGVAAALALAFSLADACLRARQMAAYGLDDIAWRAATSGMYVAVVFGGFGVVSCWGLMAASGRWRAEPTWIDRLGRALGVGWIVAAGPFRLLDHIQ